MWLKLLNRGVSIFMPPVLPPLYFISNPNLHKILYTTMASNPLDLLLLCAKIIRGGLYGFLLIGGGFPNSRGGLCP